MQQFFKNISTHLSLDTTILGAATVIVSLGITGLFVAVRTRNNSHYKNGIRKSLLTIFLFFLLFIVGLVALESTRNNENTLRVESSFELVQNISADDVEVPEADEDLVVSLELEQKTFDVIRVIDGDTIDVDIDGEKTRIRIIGIDTPETNVYECYGMEATIEARRLLDGKQVTLEADPTQDDVDRYNRFLRFVFVENVDFGLRMVETGFAEEYTYRKPYKYTSAYKEAETQAKLSQIGIWGSACENWSNKKPD